MAPCCGPSILGLAPSATAADQLAHHLPAAPQVIGAETLAKLAWDLGHGGALAEAIGRRTLLIIDEAGMADTLTLDKVVQHALARGASVRLVGDDQQLGAIGAGGVLRDIAAQHGAHRLVAVLRFAHPAEADASLALRTGTRDSLGFYYDHGRVHATDPATATQNLFTAWLTDTRAGRDALMLAPTRALVAELNHAARQARLANGLPGREVLLSDGNAASVGDTILTRRNDRALVDGDTRWVRNGDRWQITRIRRAGSVDARNLRTGGRVTLPADYLARSVELGYATTIHGAQGVTADTCHGIVTGAETRQQLYTALTRGRHANHAWVQVTTGDPTHLAPADQDLHAARPVDDILEAVLARDDAPVSATAQLAQADNPVKLLGHAVACYLDAIGFAAEHHLTDQTQRAIDEAGDRYGFDQAEAWPTLRAHLALFAANGHHPAAVLAEAVGRGGLETAHDPAAVVDWRLDLTEANHRTRGPLPWLPGIPTQLLDSPVWKSYLSQRYQLARHLVDEADAFVKAAPPPAWAGRVPAVLDPGTIADIEIWRAAHLVPDSDLRPTGPAQHHPAEAAVQHLLDLDIQGAALDVTHWTSQASLAAPAVACDPDLVVLGMRLARLAGTRSDIALLLADAARQGALPDDRPAAALGYRVTALAATTAEPDIDVWEVIQSPAPADRARSFEHQMPPPAHHPDRGPGIGH